MVFDIQVAENRLMPNNHPHRFENAGNSRYGAVLNGAVKIPFNMIFAGIPRFF